MKVNRSLVLLWFAWCVLVLSFQALATARLVPQFPDRALGWTSRFTGAGYQEGHVYLLEPFMNDQVAWDSEYYLAIAVGGYDNPRSPHLTPRGVITRPEGFVPEPEGRSISLSYAFFPFYPLMMLLFAYPLQILGMNPIATATLAGVIVSALGTLLGMHALYSLGREGLGEDGGLRAAFYLIAFPTGFFLIQVYTEGLFVGLAYGCLALFRQRHWPLAAFLGAAAALTRAVGVLLIIPLMIAWFRAGGWQELRAGARALPQWGRLLLVCLPLITFVVWKFSYLGQGFDYVEANYFQRGFLSLDLSFRAWREALGMMMSGSSPQTTAYYLTEFLGLALGLAASLVLLRIDPEVAWFSLAVLLVSWASGPAQGIHRYILGAPAVFLALARWGRHPVFDRAWTLLSVLLLGLLAMLFAFNMWVA